jgi:hypothetical protein
VFRGRGRFAVCRLPRGADWLPGGVDWLPRDADWLLRGAGAIIYA